jgi:hypothetical protein
MAATAVLNLNIVESIEFGNERESFLVMSGYQKNVRTSASLLPKIRAHIFKYHWIDVRESVLTSSNVEWVLQGGCSTDVTLTISFFQPTRRQTRRAAVFLFATKNLFSVLFEMAILTENQKKTLSRSEVKTTPVKIKCLVSTFLVSS